MTFSKTQLDRDAATLSKLSELDARFLWVFSIIGLAEYGLRRFSPVR